MYRFDKPKVFTFGRILPAHGTISAPSIDAVKTSDDGKRKAVAIIPMNPKMDPCRTSYINTT